ncbi:hypothetical protein Back11_51300 [Paenibacillus baekrokdamisoli]|uniref:Uncharacterized protein n=1 Tax=Paenibacillus baekrokdamisoli TaxID=1712516 RepID=A0A3G9J664_9BACL|nr:hypothetical protein [Paenibacillus baekrokdamisoli]BBH23785.1 hypothetical protein Back11_51300 [Paenibacillus baekrokdamisoli]
MQPLIRWNVLPIAVEPGFLILSPDKGGTYKDNPYRVNYAAYFKSLTDFLGFHTIQMKE